MGELAETWFVSLRYMPGRGMHIWRERVWCPPRGRSAIKRQLSHLYRSLLPGLCLPLADYLFFFYTWPTLGTWVCTHLSPRWIWSEGSWEEQGLLWPGIIPWLLTHMKPFSSCVLSPLSKKGRRGSEIQRTLNSLFRQGLSKLKWIK